MSTTNFSLSPLIISGMSACPSWDSMSSVAMGVSVQGAACAAEAMHSAARAIAIVYFIPHPRTKPSGGQDDAQYRLCRILRARVIVQDRRQPALGGCHVPAFAARIVFHLIAFDLAGAEIAAVRMREI